jgi:ubiquinone/menaquinone biosynthesis C-methylase UbiE
MADRRPRNEASRRYHDRVARQYDSIYDDPYWEFHDELTWRRVKPWLPRDANAACCDLGCGTGKWGLKLLKSGFATTFVDHSASMVEQVRPKLDAMGPRGGKGTLVVADIVAMPVVPSDAFALVVAMGDPLSICSNATAAVREIARITRPEGVVIATADNKLAAIDHFAQKGSLDDLEAFIASGKTNWLTADERERFELTTFTPASLRRVFDSNGFETVEVTGKTVIPVRNHRELLQAPDAVERLLKIEAELSKDPAAAGRCGHLQIVARRRGKPH